MNEYRVVWKVVWVTNVQAESPVEAAELAYMEQTQDGSKPGVYEVYQRKSMHDLSNVSDLDYIDTIDLDEVADNDS